MIKKKIRYLLCVIMTVFAAFALAGCGGEIATTVNVNNAGSGSRVMTVTWKKEDLSSSDGKDALHKTMQQIIDIVKSNTPSELTFNGLKEDNTEYIATFTLSFNSLDDYKTKVEKLINGDEKSVTLKYDNLNSTLVKGILLDENFDSQDLLQWLPKVLVDNAVIDSDNQSYVFSSTDVVTVNFDGKSYKNESSQVDINNVTDNGFKSIQLVVSKKSEKFVAQVNYYKAGETAEKIDAQNAFLNSLKDVTVTKPTSESYDDPDATVTVEASSLGELANKVKPLLGNSNVDFSIGDPTIQDAKIIRKLSLKADCSQICSVNNNMNILYSPEGTENNEVQSDENSLETTIDESPVVKTLTATFDVQSAKSVHGKLHIVLVKKPDNKISTLLRKFFKHENIETTIKGNAITLDLGTDTFKNMNKHLYAIGEGSSIEYILGKDNVFTGDAQVEASIVPTKLPLKSNESSSLVKITSSKLGYSVSENNSGNSTVAKIHYIKIIPLVILGILIIVLLVVLIVFRKKIIIFIQKTKLHAKEMQAKNKQLIQERLQQQEQKQNNTQKTQPVLNEGIDSVTQVGIAVGIKSSENTSIAPSLENSEMEWDESQLV